MLIVLDSVRADGVTPYGYQKDTTPFLQQLAGSATVFERAYAASTWTPSSMASNFTSLYVNQHGVFTGYRTTREALERGEDVRLNRIPSTVETLPEVMRRLGYRTFGVADNVNICEPMGFDRGFDRFVAFNKKGSEAVNEVVRGWRDDILSEGRYFLYVHYMDAHRPYLKRAPWYDEGTPPANESRAAYDSNLSALDAKVREVFELLGLPRGALVVVTADHGEEFLDHGGVGHQNTLYDELLRVPLIVRLPGSISRRRVKEPVSTIDLLPTFREFGGDAPSSLDQGVSLLAAQGGRGEPRTFYPMRWTEVDKRPIVRKAVLREHHKYIVTEPDGVEELYDLQVDPREKVDLTHRRPEIAADLRERLRAFERSARVFTREFAPPTHVPPELAERLKALGYVQ